MYHPDTKTIDAYAELMQQPSVTSRPVVYLAVAVCFGKLVRIANNNVADVQLNVERYVTIVARQLAQADSFAKKVSALECL